MEGTSRKLETEIWEEARRIEERFDKETEEEIRANRGTIRFALWFTVIGLVITPIVAVLIGLFFY